MLATMNPEVVTKWAGALLVCLVDAVCIVFVTCAFIDLVLKRKR